MGWRGLGPRGGALPGGPNRSFCAHLLVLDRCVLLLSRLAAPRVCSVDACRCLLVVGSLTLGRSQPPQLKPLPPLPPVCSSWLCIALSAPLGVLCVSALSPCCLACARIWRTVRSFCAAAWVPRACWPGASRFIWFDRVRLVLCFLWFRVEPRVLCVRLVSRLFGGTRVRSCRCVWALAGRWTF